MSNDQEKPQPIEQKRDAGDKAKPGTSQKTATESISDEKQAKRHAENFESLSQDTKALGHHTKAEQPFVLHDSKTGETLYDASKRHSKVLDEVSKDADKSTGKKRDVGTKAGERLVQMDKSSHGTEHRESGISAGERLVKMEQALHNDKSSHGTEHRDSGLKAGERLLQMEQALRRDMSRHSGDQSSDLSSASHKIPTPELRPGDSARQVVRRSDRSENAGIRERGSSDSTDAPHERTRVGDTASGTKAGPIKQEFSAWIPDYKTVGTPGAIPKLVEVHMSPKDNLEIERHYKESLHGRDDSKLSDFDRSKLRNLAICDVAIDKYQAALTKSELNDTRNMPDQMRGLMLAGAALQDGAALGATKAVFHKVIEGGAIGDLASGTAMGMAFGKVVATLAANVNPWTRGAALLLRTGGVALAIKEVGDIGSHGWDGLIKSIPALDEVCKHPDEKTFARAKESIAKNLGDPLADAALVGLGFAAAHGIEKAVPGGAKGGGKGSSHESTHHNTRPGANHGELTTQKAHPEQAHHGDNTGNKSHPEPTANKRETHRENRVEEQRHNENQHEKPKLVHSEYSCENKTDDVIRVLKCGEHEEQMLLMQGWFNSIPKGHVEAGSPIKVHVLTDSAADLGKVQRALIPELMRDPVLLKHIAKWKGQDPNIGLKGEGHARAVEPTGVGQGAKGLTIYTATAEDALIVQRRIDGILHEKGLSLDKEIATGNTEVCPGLSKRASICRDTFAQGRDPSGRFGPVIDEAVAQNIHGRYNVKHGERLTPENIKNFEKHTGVKEGSITYSTDGRLMVRGDGGNPNYHGGYYASESGIPTAMGQRVERPALYAIYKACGFDPCNPAIIWKK